ncbi:hypothetical protein PM10SUCC1_30650 [Propionigenium maris DSM 9537]|uniref:Secretin/TonB short N-terminal domain-containing protein n=1 Tax=Propionigenium maris DSM 9537 TaxID=1123000 RepID=A0A9W6GPE3_9FUSO|nr:hypothetical protein [Propionigenium maris]GLI57551.1 hypothetical protein PM10SUCC1_30650 [Propionigenium maris DSM 9537]
MKKILNMVLILFFIGTYSFAQIESDKKLDLTFNTTLANTFKILERELDINLIVDTPLRNQRVDIKANDMSAKNIFKLIFQMKGLDYEKIDEKTFFIFSANRSAAYNAEITRSFDLKYTDVQLFSNLLRTTLRIPNVYVNPAENNLVVKASRAEILQVEKLLAELEDEEKYFEKTYDLSYIEADKAAETIGSFARVSATVVDEVNNRVSIRGRKNELGRIEKLLEELDKPAPQLVIEVTLMDVSEGFSEEIGFDFDSMFELNSDTDASILYNIINPNLLTLSKNSQNTEILSNPSMMVLNREEASINIGERVPIITARDLGETSGGYDVVPEVEYVNVGIILHITPAIHQDDEVTIKVEMEVSSISEYVQSDYGVYPAFMNKNIDTMIRLKDGEGVVFGGLISSEEREMTSGVPYFQDLPGIGRLFTKSSSDPKKSEIMMFITPRLIYPGEGVVESNVEKDV